MPPPPPPASALKASRRRSPRIQSNILITPPPPPPPPPPTPHVPTATDESTPSESESETDQDRATDLPSNRDNDVSMEESEADTEEAEFDGSDDDNSEAEEVTANTNMGQVRFANTSYKDAVMSNSNEIKEIQYKQRRLAVMVSIPEVDNNVDRLHHLVLQLNNFLKFARKRNTKLRLRKFDDISKPNDKDKAKWRTRMIDNSSSDFKEYIHGYFPFTPPRGGMYRLRINTVMEEKVVMHDFIQNVTHDWGQKDTQSLSDIKAQKIWDPAKIGYLMRATKYITHSYELIDAMEGKAKAQGYTNIHFGISWGTIPSPVGGYDKDTAVQAVIIETNKETAMEAVKLLQKWYPLNPKIRADPPYPGNFRFVINRDHPSVKGNSIAIANLSVLMERQGIFTEDTKGEQTFSIKDLNYVIAPNLTLRDKILSIKSKTSGEEVLNTTLFMSVSKAVNNRSGQSSTWFTFHKKVANEAISIVKNLPAFIKAEWVADPEIFCFAQFLNSSDEWDPENRVANNEDTNELANAANEYTMDLYRESEVTQTQDTTDDKSMTSKAMREMNRMMGNDDETVKSISKERTKKAHSKQQNTRSPAAIEIDASQSIGAISGVSGTSTKTEAVRAKLQLEFESKFHDQEKKMKLLEKDRLEQVQKAQTMQLQLEQMAAMMQHLQHGRMPPQAPPTQESSSQPSNEDSAERAESNRRATEQLASTPNKGVNTILPVDSEEVDFGEDAGDEDYAIWKQEQEIKRLECIKLGIEFNAESYDHPMDEAPNIPLPNSPHTEKSIDEYHDALFDTDDEEVPAKSPRGKFKRIVQTQSDELGNPPSNAFFSNHSTRDKKRTNAAGSVNPTFNV